MNADRDIGLGPPESLEEEIRFKKADGRLAGDLIMNRHNSLMDKYHIRAKKGK